jgi:transcriptional regulator with XRE-family HTH domain
MGAGPETVAGFIIALRELKSSSGRTYRELARGTNYSHSALADAVSGRRMPSLELTLAFVRACDGDEEEWHKRWQRVAAQRPRLAAAMSIKPERISLHSELVAALREMRMDRSYSELDSASGGLLSSSTLSDMLSGRTLPTWETLRTYLSACEQPTEGWAAVLERVRRERGSTPYVRRVPVLECDPVELGVHALDSGVQLPPYVPREFDHLVKSVLHHAQATGGFVLLVGASGTGKTRTLFESMRRVLTDFELVHVNAVPPGTVMPPRTVVWLDDLGAGDQHPVPAQAMLHGSAGPVVLLGTMLADRYHQYSALPEPGDGKADPFAAYRSLLKHARIIDVPAHLSHRELDRLRHEVMDDPLLHDAVQLGKERAIQLLTAAPHLLRRVQHAPGYAKAVIAAAIEADVNGSGPQTAAQLGENAVLRMNEEDWAVAPDDWFAAALRYATAREHGNLAVLSAVSPAGPLATRRYAVADYVAKTIRRQWNDGSPNELGLLLPPGAARARAMHAVHDYLRAHEANLEQEATLEQAACSHMADAKPADSSLKADMVEFLRKRSKYELAEFIRQAAFNEVEEDQLTDDVRKATEAHVVKFVREHSKDELAALVLRIIVNKR